MDWNRFSLAGDDRKRERERMRVCEREREREREKRESRAKKYTVDRKIFKTREL